MGRPGLFVWIAVIGWMIFRMLRNPDLGR